MKTNEKKTLESLTNYYDSIVKDSDVSKAVKFMKSSVMKDITDEFLEMSENNSDLEEDDQILLKWILKITNMIYNHSGEETGLSDSEYDELSEYYKNQTQDESIITEEETKEDTVTHKYKTLRGTLDKIYKLTDEDVLKNKSQKSLEDWVKQTERRYLENTGDTINLWDCDVIEMPKFDGVSCVFECSKDGTLLRALTRGNTKNNEAQDITHVFKEIFTSPVKDAKADYGLKTEIMMLDEDLEAVNKLSPKKYKNTRSVVSSILNSDELDGRELYLHIVPLRYSYLEKGNQESQQYLPITVYEYPYVKCKLKDVDTLREFAINHKTVQPGLRCDGSVIRIIDENIQKALGRENEKQKFEVAFKFTEETSYSKVKDVIFTTGLFGRVNPVAVIQPVKMKGNKVEKASLGSFGRYKDLELCKGDIVKVLYDIIPYIDFDENDPNCVRSGNKPIKVPKICPDCGEELELSDTGELLYCVNTKCPCREKGRILNYCRKMDIANISYATINDLYEENILRSIQDLYSLKNQVNTISQLNGYGSGKIKNILSEIDSHRTVIPSTLLGSIGIEGLSRRMFKKILEYMTMSEIIEISHDNNYDFFTVIPGIKEKTAKKLVDGINDSIELIQFLINELDVENEPRSKGSFSVVFTKVRDEEKEKFVKESGGEVSDSLTKDTSILVVPMNGIKSSKVSKAEKYNIPIVAIDDLESYITKNYL